MTLEHSASVTLPALDPDTHFFWTSGRDGRLRFLRCDTCEQFIHPPAPACPACRSTLKPTAVSGRGQVFSATVNHHPWSAGSEVPYALAIVEIEEQPGLRLTTNIVNCAPGDVAVGMRVRVIFAEHDPIYLPLFEPVREISDE